MNESPNCHVRQTHSILPQRLNVTILHNVTFTQIVTSPVTLGKSGSRLWLLLLIVEVVETAVYFFNEPRWGMCHSIDNAPEYWSFGARR